MKAVRTSGKAILRMALWCAVTFTLALLMAAGYKIGETFALSQTDVFLEIASASPALESGRAGRDPLLRLRFTEPLDPRTVNEYCFSLGRDSMRIPAKIAWDEATRTVTVAPKRSLEPGDYHLEVSTDVLSKNNRRMMDRFSRTFRVE